MTARPVPRVIDAGARRRRSAARRAWPAGLDRRAAWSPRPAYARTTLTPQRSWPRAVASPGVARCEAFSAEPARPCRADLERRHAGGAAVDGLERQRLDLDLLGAAVDPQDGRLVGDERLHHDARRERAAGRAAGVRRAVRAETESFAVAGGGAGGAAGGVGAGGRRLCGGLGGQRERYERARARAASCGHRGSRRRRAVAPATTAPTLSDDDGGEQAGVEILRRTEGDRIIEGVESHARE